MDVLCVFDADGKPYCTEFFVKLKSAAVDDIAIAALGLHEEGCCDESTSVFPRHVSKDIAEAAKWAHLAGHPSQRNDYVQVTCNGQICSEVTAFIGEQHLLHFYDREDMSYAKTPSSNVLKCFDLKLGKNEVSCIHFGSNLFKEFNIWRYNPNDRLVIMDIDGTITKSDVTGYIQTVYMGMFSYVHEGIVPFLRSLREVQGFHMIYLTARPLAHQRETKQLLEGVRDRAGGSLPDGPLFPNKDRLLAALYREVISKTTMQLKTLILNSISRVFGKAGCTRRTPFVLGIGNKEADALAYNLAGLNAESILLINKTSRIEVWKYQQLLRLGTSAEVVQQSAEEAASQKRRSRSVDAAVYPALSLLPPGASAGAVGEEPRFSDSSSDGSQSPLQGLDASPRQWSAKTPPSSSGAGGASARNKMTSDSAAVLVDSGVVAGTSTGGGNASNGNGNITASSSVIRTLTRAFSGGIVGNSPPSSVHSTKGSRDDISTGTSSSGKGGGGGAYVFNTYGDPRLLQYVQGVSLLR
jgi:hypothetical protein